MTELISIRPETPLFEEWRWNTDVMTSRNGTEQRVDCSVDVPRRALGGKYIFLDQAAINRFVMAVVTAKGVAVNVPFFQYATALNSPAILGASSLTFDARRTELRDGDYALLFDDDEIAFELVQIGTLGASSSSLIGTTAAAWPAGTLICPVHQMIYGSGLALQRLRVDGAANVDLNFVERAGHAPFVNPYNDTALTTYSSLPVILDRPIGREFDEEFVTGADVTDYGGLIDVISPWNRAKMKFVRRWYVRRVMLPAEWEFWQKFGFTVRGAAKPFWLPSYRQDYTVVTPPAPSGTQMTLSGHFFRDYCYPFVGLKSFFIESDGGMHLATATNVTNLGGNDRVTFSPALPAGAAYSANQKIGILHRCRMTDGRMAWQHFDGHSTMEMGIISTDQ